MFDILLDRSLKANPDTFKTRNGRTLTRRATVVYSLMLETSTVSFRSSFSIMPGWSSLVAANRKDLVGRQAGGHALATISQPEL